MTGYGRHHSDMRAEAALWFGLLLVVAIAICAWQDQRDLPESANSEVVQ